jgi:hypothetical protein
MAVEALTLFPVLDLAPDGLHKDKGLPMQVMFPDTTRADEKRIQEFGRIAIAIA